MHKLFLRQVHGCLTDSRRKYIGTESDSSIMHITLTRVVRPESIPRMHTVEIECITSVDVAGSSVVVFPTPIAFFDTGVGLY